MSPRWAAATLALALSTACAGAPAGSDAGPVETDHYLRYVAFELPFREVVYLHWPERSMPLRVHLPRPPEGYYADADAVLDVVRDGVLDWSDIAGPDLPSFVFVPEARNADIRIAWALESPDPTWYVAHCSWDIDASAKRLGVDRILVTARWKGREPALDTIYATVLHEMGHALGLGGHSPDRRDTMYRSVVHEGRPSLTARDRETLRQLYARPNGSRAAAPRRVD